MANLRIGSSGDEVKKLQNALISAGYNVGNTGADGVFGKNTDAAVRKYQRDNQLAVDGVAGQDTQGMLYGTGTTATGTGNNSATTVDPSAPVTSQAGFTYGDFQYEDFKPSDAVQQANALLQQQQANKPGAWTDPHQDKWMGYLSQYENRGPFSYDVNADALYQQYKDQYIQQGQLAMMDTMGQAAAMTGGYGNSYAQSVGQQAYTQQLGKLNEVVPELYGMAYDRYQQDGQKLLDQYSLYKGLSDQSYAQHQDTVDNWYREMSRLTGERDAALAERSNEKSDLINLIAATGYKPTDAELEKAGMTRGQADSYATAYVESKVAEGETKPKEQTASQEDIDRVLKKIANCKDEDELNAVYESLLDEGWGENWVKIWVKRKDAEFLPQSAETAQGKVLAPHTAGSNGRYTY